MRLEEFVTSKSGQAWLKEWIQYYSFKYQLNFSDIFSDCNYNLGLAISNDRECANLDACKSYTRSTVYNACNLRFNYNQRHGLVGDDITGFELEGNRYSDFESADQFEQINKAILSHYAGKPNVIEIYNRVIINGEEQREVSSDLGITDGSGRVILNRIKKKARELNIFVNKIAELRLAWQ